MSLPSGQQIELRLFVDPRCRVTSVQENEGDTFIVQVPLRHGSVQIKCEGGVLFDGEVRPGLMRVLAPGERVRIFRRSPAEGAALTIPASLFRRIANEHGFATHDGLSLVDPVVEPDPRIARLGWLLGTVCTIDPKQRALFVEGVTLALLSLALGARSGASADLNGRDLTRAQVDSCRAYAESRMGGGLDLASWAEAVGLAPGEFARRFRHTMRSSPYAWFLQQRIEASKLLLMRDGMSLATVALEVGFSSQSHFTEAFKRQVGASPGRWRAHLLS